MDEVADRLHARPARRRLAEEVPRDLRQPIGLAIAAAEQEHQCFLRQIRHGHLLRLRHDRVGSAGIVDDDVRADARAALRRDDARAPVAEAVAVGGHRDRRVDGQIVAPEEVGDTREVHVQVEDHRRGLRAVVDHFKADAYSHHESPLRAGAGRRDPAARWVEVDFAAARSAPDSRPAAASAHAARNESISTPRNALQRRGGAAAMPWLISSSIPT